MSYVGWLLPDHERNLLLAKFPPAYSDVRADHITLTMNSRAPLPEAVRGQVIGVANTDGVQALVVSIDGSIIRPDGRIYHITMSIEPPRKPKHSNDILKLGWTPLATPIDISLTPHLF